MRNARRNRLRSRENEGPVIFNEGSSLELCSQNESALWIELKFRAGIISFLLNEGTKLIREGGKAKRALIKERSWFRDRHPVFGSDCIWTDDEKKIPKSA